MTQDLSITHGEHRGFPALLVTTPFSTAAVSLHGGQVLSFVVEGFDDALWLSPESTIRLASASSPLRSIRARAAG